MLAPLAKALGLVASYETGLFRAGSEGQDYRTPDIIVARPEHCTPRGVEGTAEFLIEILSPGDESYEKLEFYEQLGVREALYVKPDPVGLELFVLGGKKLRPMTPDAAGALRSQVLGVAFAIEAGALGLRWNGGDALIRGERA